MIDNGYDISDYKQIDSVFGNLQDFKELVETFHNLDIKVIIDFVPNHSSDQHEWFQKSRRKVEPFTDFYVWRDRPNNWVRNNCISCTIQSTF